MRPRKHRLPDERLQPLQADPFTLPHALNMYGQLSGSSGPAAAP
ncbi:hypothetical protein AB0N81_40155 [Streptomyces sp. NPDC093510]